MLRAASKTVQMLAPLRPDPSSFILPAVIILNAHHSTTPNVLSHDQAQRQLRFDWVKPPLVVGQTHASKVRTDWHQHF
jgi:hypothetical protein